MIPSILHRLSISVACLFTAGIVAGLFVCCTPHQANAATYYFDVDGSTPGFGDVNGLTFDWDDTANGGLWSSAATGDVATGGWAQGNFPRFNAGTTGQAYTVNVSNVQQIAGMWQSSAGVTLTINAVGSGALEMAAGIQGIIGSAGSTTIINAPITGDGIINPNNGGNLYLNGPNTYTNGTSLTSSATLIFFNSSASFGTGDILVNVNSTTNFAPVLGTGGTTITLPNNFLTGTPTNSGINFATAANTPIVSTGSWNLSSSLRVRNNGDSTSPLTITGNIFGTGNLTLSANNNGSIILTSANSYSGITTITGPGGAGTGNSPIRLKLGIADSIAYNLGVVLAGGILDPGGFNQAMPTAPLGLTANSTIDFASGASEVSFADSSTQTWTGTLNLTNWNANSTKLRFGTDALGLTSTQLATIQFNGAGLGTAQLDANGYVITVGLPGDFNNDNKVDASDFVIWRKNNNTNNTLPNDNGLGTPIGSQHYDLWRDNFGKPTPAAGSSLDGTVVPEPSSLTLLMFALATLASGRRKR